MTENRQLAEEIVRLMNGKSPRKYGYYLCNINHPVIGHFYRSFLLGRGMQTGFPPDDVTRVEFELSIFNSEVTARLKDLILHKKIDTPTDQSEGV